MGNIGKKNRTNRMLWFSMIGMCVLCACVFSYLTFYIGRSSSETMNEVGAIYMQGLNERITQHFETTIGYQLSHLEKAIEAAPPDSETDLVKVKEKLEKEARNNGLEYLGFYSREGTLEMLYGGNVMLDDPDPFMESMEKGERKAAIGDNGAGERILVLGIPAEYPMEDGSRSLALIAGVSIDYIKDLLALDDSNMLVSSHIIRRDGTFVIRSGDAFRDNYFDRVSQALSGEKLSTEQFIEELTSAMEAREDYSAVLTMGEERHHLYCSSMPNTEWYLVTELPYGQLDQIVDSMSDRWMWSALGGCGILLVVLMMIFIGYLRESSQRIKELEQAHRDAEHANQIGRAHV